VWAGPECSYLTVGDRLWDQLALTGHARRSGDPARLASLGVSGVRYPVLWGRSSGRRAATDWRWAASRVARLVDLGTEPIVGLLHHGFGPTGADPLDPGWPAAFGRYARRVAERLPAVRSFLPINEPLTTARFGGLYGWWPPYARDPGVFAALLVAHAEAYLEAARAIRAVRPDARLIVNEDIGTTFSTPSLAELAELHNERRWLTFDLVTGRVGRWHPLRSSLAGTRERRRILDRLHAEPEPPDVLGVDHYATSDRFLDERLERYPGHAHAHDDGRSYATVEMARVAGRPVDGFDLAIRETWRRYGIPVALTEVQLAGEPIDQVAWWHEAWSAASCSAGDGIPIVAVTAWSTFGAYDWGSILRRPESVYEAGCFELPGRGRPRRTPLADAVALTARGIDPRDPPLGWWRRPERVLYDPGRSDETAGADTAAA
jgi:dTDP-4-dehydrorhamnose reductase